MFWVWLSRKMAWRISGGREKDIVGGLGEDIEKGDPAIEILAPALPGWKGPTAVCDFRDGGEMTK